VWFSFRWTDKKTQAEEAAEKVLYFVIPSEARNLSLCYVQQKERFLGEKPASE